MTDADFLYYYAKLYHQYNVKAVLMIENWTDKDCDAKYAKYMQEYIRIKEVFKEKNLSDDRIKMALEAFKKDRLNSTYDTLFRDMIERLENREGTFSPQKREAIKSKLAGYKTLDDANYEFLYELRKIEEEEY
ncbi:MAG: hypothetical protein FWD40_01035 [Treponema sp.]|nr:hypothetical protein [Treponema sp.]